MICARFYVFLVLIYYVGPPGVSIIPHGVIIIGGTARTGQGDLTKSAACWSA